jgi:hypothetical protein
LITGNKDLLIHWFLLWLIGLTLAVYLIIAHTYGHDLWQLMTESQRIFLRTLFYVITIIGFPLTNLIRHVLLRLNHTMPGNTPASSRYLLTVLVSLLFAETIALFGFVMFMLGDDFNTLYIFTGLSALGLYLYRPKEQEYQSIVQALIDQ